VKRGADVFVPTAVSGRGLSWPGPFVRVRDEGREAPFLVVFLQDEGVKASFEHVE